MVGWAMLWWVLGRQPDMGWLDAQRLGGRPIRRPFQGSRPKERK